MGKQNTANTVDLSPCFVSFRGKETLNRRRIKSKLPLGFLACAMDSYDEDFWQSLTHVVA